MDPQSQFCHNLACPDRRQSGRGNIRIHSLNPQLSAARLLVSVSRNLQAIRRIQLPSEGIRSRSTMNSR
jgi:hypothetical protein